MKIYTRSEFLKLPKGTFFVKSKEPEDFNGFCIKYESICDQNGIFIDFFYLNLVDIDYHSSEERFVRIDLINQSSMRDGCFDDDDLFLVFEKKDLKIIHEYIQEFIFNGEGF